MWNEFNYSIKIIGITILKKFALAGVKFKKEANENER